MSQPQHKAMPSNVRIVINTQPGQGEPLYFVDARFSLEQVESLNAFQSSGVMHRPDRSGVL